MLEKEGGTADAGRRATRLHAWEEKRNHSPRPESRGNATGDREGRDRLPAVRQRTEMVRFALLKRIFGLGGTLATTLVGLATRIAVAMPVHTYGCYINCLLGRPQGRI